MAENNSHRKFCVVWTTIAKTENKDCKVEEHFTDHSKFFEEEEEKDANDLYEELLKKEDTYCASFCKILKDSEG